MGRTLRSLFAVVIVAITGAIGCTVQDTKAPALMGPSGLAVSLTLQADRPILERGSFTAVRVRAVNHQNQPMAMSLRAELMQNGRLFDYGRLSTRDLTTGSDGTALVTYFAPPPLALPTDSGQDTVTIRVTPVSGGDSRGLLAREVDIRLVPLGLISLPMQALFTFTPPAALVGQTVNFDASSSLRGGTPCMDECGYTWTFGDGTSTMGRVVNKVYSAPGTYEIYMRVSDGNRLTVDSSPRTIVVTPVPPPTASFSIVPTSPTVGSTVVFTSTSTVGEGRTIVSYEWNFHDGAQPMTGVMAQKTYAAPGAKPVTLTVTDNLGLQGTSTQQVTVAAVP